MNRYFRDSLELAIRSAVEEAGASTQLNHNYLRGKLREIAIRGLIQPWLTRQYGVGTGKVTDCNGTLSNEVDLLIYGTDINPPVFYSEDGFGLYPCEACLATVEVKTRLDAAGLRSALDGAGTLSQNHLEFQSGRLDETGTKTVAHGFIEIANCLFAFDTDLTDLIDAPDGELRRYHRYADEATGKRLSMLCVVGRGCWVAKRNPDRTNEWVRFDATDRFDEVVSFCSILSSSLAAIHRDRGQPPLSTYMGLPQAAPTRG